MIINQIKIRLELIKKLNFIVNKSGNFNLSFIIFLLVLKSFFETVGIGLIYPFIDIIINDSLIEKNYFFKILLELSIISSKNDFLILLGLILIVFIIFSMLISLYAKIKAESFLWKTNSDIIKISYKKYIYENLLVYKKSNANKITHNVINEVHIFINGFLLNFIDLIPRIFLLIFFIGYLLFINPIVTIISLFFLIIFYGTLLGVLKTKINKMSKLRYLYQNSLFDYVNSSIRALKDIKVNSFEKYFISKIEEPAKHFSDLNKGISIYSSIPKIFIETFILVILVIYVLYNFNDNIVQQIPMLSILTLAVIKLLPIIQGMFTNITRMRFNYNSINIIEKNINASNKIVQQFDSKNFFFKSIELIGIGFNYDKKEVFKNISFKVENGDFWLLYGESGSGKTTLTEIMLGFILPTSGKIMINSKFDKANSILSKKLNVGYVSQDIILFEGNFIENIILKSNYKFSEIKEKINFLVDFFSMYDIIESIGGLEGFISESGKNLSAGQRQRIILARALFRNPDLLILDEATSALNSDLEERIIDKLIKSKITIFMITHNESLKRFTKKIVILNNRKKV
jgi:ABC-type bacteriocin/lantibiotic exporter with double-glycine peptidase domain